MAEDQLVSFIIRSRQKGRTDEQIKSALLSVGWKKDRVESAFVQIARRPAEAESAEPEPQKQPQGIAPQISSPITSVQPAGSRQPPSSQPPQAVSQQPAGQDQQLPQQAGMQPARFPSSQPATPASPQQPEVSPQPALQAEARKKGPLSFLSGLAGKIRPPKGKQQAQAALEQGPVSPPAQAPYAAGMPSHAAAQPAPSQIPPAKRIVPPPLPGSAQASAQTAQPSLPSAKSPPSVSAGAPKSQLPVKAAIVVILLLFAGAIYVAVTSKPAAPPSQPAVLPNQTQPNATAGQAANASRAQGQPPANQSSGNASANPRPPQPNQSQVTPPSTPPVQPQPTPPVIRVVPPSQNATPPVQPPASQPEAQPPASPPVQPSSNQTFARITAYQSSGPFFPEKFCSMDNNGTFVRAHFKEYYGGDCTSEKNKDGFANLTTLRANCSIVPCCVAGPYKEYSIKYDYFECGYVTYP